jgi:quinoprotein glucose dehydrogenase
MPYRSSRVAAASVLALALAVSGPSGGAHAQSGTQKGEWPTYGGDLASTHYSPLDQITPQNFNRLELAWRFKTDALGPRPEFSFQSTPLMVGGVLYSTAGSRRDVIALDAATGELLWMHGENEGKRGDAAPRRLSGRGLAYWSDGRDARILYVTPGYRLVALDAKTGVPVAGFGKNGVVDLKLDDDQDMNLETADVGLHATPVVAKNVVVIGAAHAGSFVPKSRTNVKGYVRGFDVRTGKRLWIFHTIPQPGEFGNDTWEKDSWSYTGNTGVWGQVSIDEELGLVYLPVELPTGDFYGGHRPGNGLFGESIVAVDLQTGKRRWHYQLVHHGIWDMDIPCAPILIDITVGGRPVKALAQPTKQGWLYTFDRATGTPVWPIEERPVPKGDVPGEWYSPTQPFPTKPPAYERQGVTLDDLIDFTPELKAEAVKLAARYRLGPLYTPPVVSRWEGPLATLMLPSNNGGTNWPGGSFDPETKRLYVYSLTRVTAASVVPTDGIRSDEDYVTDQAHDPRGPAPVEQLPTNIPQRFANSAEAGIGGALTVQGLPFIKPPYGRITAFDMNQGDIVWQVAHGETPDNVREHPALKGLTIPRTGRLGYVGILVTKTLVVAGEAGVATTPNGQRGAMLRAYDKATGVDVGAVYMPAPQSGTPMTYMVNGKQYIVVAISGGAYSGELLAFRLPS